MDGARVHTACIRIDTCTVLLPHQDRDFSVHPSFHQLFSLFQSGYKPQKIKLQGLRTVEAKPNADGTVTRS